MFVHYYTQEGMSQDEFLEAEMNVNDLIGEFSYGMNYQAEEEEFEWFKLLCIESFKIYEKHFKRISCFFAFQNIFYKLVGKQDLNRYVQVKTNIVKIKGFQN